jgi:hypothetical protein
MNPPLTLPAERSGGLDALRGLAILLMCFNGVAPWTGLPNWFYHGYEPRFLHDGTAWQAVAIVKPLSNYPGFTMIDFVFPAFLFAMGVAIPLALNGRRERGTGSFSQLTSIVVRWLMLVFFALYCQQVKPGLLGTSNATAGLWLSLVGFLVLFPIFVRLPATLTSGWKLGIRAMGFVMAIALLLVANTRDGAKQPFAWTVWGNVDGIILILAHCYLVAAIAWIVLPRWPWVRLLLLLPLIVLFHHDTLIGKQFDHRWWGTAFNDWLTRHGWQSASFYYNYPRELLNLPMWVQHFSAGRYRVTETFTGLLNLSSLWDSTFLKYLMLVVPGTIVGDAILRHRGRADESTKSLSAGASLLILLVTVGTFAGLRNYGQPADWWKGLQTPYVTLLLTVPQLLGLLILTRKLTPLDRSMIRAGSLVLAPGIAAALAPALKGDGFFEGGIGKGPPATMSYYLVCIGLSLLLLALFRDWIDVRKTRLLNLLVYTGQNPLMGYLGPRILLPVLCGLPLLLPIASYTRGHTTLEQYMSLYVFQGSAWTLLVWGLIKLLVLALIVGFFSKRKVFWTA